MSRLTSEAGAGVAVPVVAAVAVNRTGAGAAGVRHAAARLHIHLPRLRQTQRPAHTQTLQANKQTNKRVQIHGSTTQLADISDEFAISNFYKALR